MLWIHANTAARFDQGMHELARVVRVPGRDNPQANVFHLICDWLRDNRNGKWVIVVDSADDANFLLEPPGTDAEQVDAGVIVLEENSRIEHLPVCKHGSILFTSRSREMVAESVINLEIVIVPPMAKEIGRAHV